MFLETNQIRIYTQTQESLQTQTVEVVIMSAAHRLFFAAFLLGPVCSVSDMLKLVEVIDWWVCRTKYWPLLYLVQAPPEGK